MSAELALFDAYRKWQRLARAGQRAIGKKDWGFLLECQNVIRATQPSLAKLLQEARNEWRRSNVDCAKKENELRSVILELKEVLESNHKLLRAARTIALTERGKLVQVGQNLKRLQNSYVAPRSCAWTSVS